ncbi:MAG: hypothetical protein U9Q67_01710, partial [Patescibacteria group bacterium]|nr:hypothetical protein [Patescibacteria group bacterium]
YSTTATQTTIKTNSKRQQASIEFQHTVGRTMQLADVVLQQACKDGSTDKAVSCLERIATGIEKAEFVDLRKRRRGRSRRQSTPSEHRRMGDLKIGNLLVSAFIDQDLSIDEIIIALNERKRSDTSFGEIAEGIIPSLLSAELEHLNIEPNKLKRSRLLYNNIVRYRDWMLEKALQRDIAPILNVLPAFEDVERMRLGYSVGTWLADKPSEAIALVQAAPDSKLSNEESTYFEDFAKGVMLGMWENNHEFRPFEQTVAERALVERREAEEALLIASETIETELERAFPKITKLVSTAKEIVIKSADSLYLYRLGITELKFSSDKQHISAEITLACGFKFDVGLVPPSKRPRDWVQEFSINNRITDNRTSEIAIYIQAILLDLIRYKKAIRSMDKGARESAAAIFTPRKRKKKPGTPLEIARYLLAEAGYTQPLVIEEHRVPLVDLQPHVSLKPQDFPDYRRYLLSEPAKIEPTDFIDPYTGEVTRTAGCVARCYRTKIFPLLALTVSLENPSAQLTSRDSIRFFYQLAKISYTGAVELAVLANL